MNILSVAVLGDYCLHLNPGTGRWVVDFGTMASLENHYRVALADTLVALQLLEGVDDPISGRFLVFEQLDLVGRNIEVILEEGLECLSVCNRTVEWDLMVVLVDTDQ